MIKIYHNENCSKSRASCELLTQKGTSFQTIDYLKNPLTKPELIDLLAKLNLPAIELIRKGEPQYIQEFEGKELTENQCIDAMVKFPILIQRPIIVKGNKAVIGRPIENLIHLIDEK